MLAALALGLSATCWMGCDRGEAPVAEDRAALFEAPPGGPTESGQDALQRRAEELARMSEEDLRQKQQRDRSSRERVRMLAAAGQPIELRGAIVAAGTRRAEENCEVSLTGQDVYSDADGRFVLYGVPSDGQVRLRIKCRGLIERHNVMVPIADGVYVLDAPIVVGRGLDPSDELTGARVAEAPPQEAVETVTTLRGIQPEQPARADTSAIEAQIQEERAEAEGEPSGLTAPLRMPGLPQIIMPRPPLLKEPEQIVSGALAAADIAPELRRRADALQGCYTALLEARPQDTAAVRVRWAIGPTGVVEGVEIHGSSFDEEDADICFTRRIARLSFPASDGVTTVTQTFVFQLGHEPEAQLP